MSPSANSKTEAANADYAPGNFASVFAFATAFSSVLRSDIREPEELEDAIRCVDGSEKLRQFALLLLATASNKPPNARLAEDQWPKLCNELAADSVAILRKLQVPEAVADSIDSFVDHDVAVRVDVLFWLAEAAVASNSSVKKLIDQEVAKYRKPSAATHVKPELVRLQPFAEIARQRYWLFGSKTRQLYLESGSQRGKGKLELLAQTPDEFTAVANELRTQRTHAHKSLADGLVEDVVPFLETQMRKRVRVEKAMQRQALALANVHIYDTRTRKRQRVNYEEDNLSALDF
ncbi:hypothetical protein H4217_009312 [Coemansia sp. RSA 1939]|nr:hypothetical protein H4217_009312 [Coemansia sp. RSA 1939]KAJ2680852.1 hypothetical protein GGH99_005372 [Coemansia sp. RSA 1285]